MSYDITFVDKSEGQTWEEALDAHEEKIDSEQSWNASATEATQAEWNRIATVLLDSHPGLFRYEAPHKVELTDLETGIQISLFEHEAAIDVPYWYSGENARRVMEIVRQLAIIIERETGLQGYDLQRGCRFLEIEALQETNRKWWEFWKR